MKNKIKVYSNNLLSQKQNYLPVVSEPVVWDTNFNYSVADLQAKYFTDIRSYLETKYNEYSADIIDKNSSISFINIDKNMLANFKHYDGEFKKITSQLYKIFSKIPTDRKHLIFYPRICISQIIGNMQKINSMPVENVQFERNSIMFLKSTNRLTYTINYWFPEILDVKVNKKKLTLIEQINDSKLLHERIIRMYGQNKLNEKLNAKILDSFPSLFKRTNGNQIAYNFPISIAKWVYKSALSQKKFSGEKEFIIIDTSLGWGSRLVGLMSSLNDKILSKKKVTFIGIDPNTKIHNGYVKLFNFWKNEINNNMRLDFYNSAIGAENILSDSIIFDYKEKVHLIFSSPPYFNKEAYSDEDTQSCVKYSDYFSWKENFLKKLIINSYKLLKTGGEFWLNIADIRNGKQNVPLEQDAFIYAHAIGFMHVKTYYMIQNIIQGARRANNVSLTNNQIIIDDKIYKYEPIFVFVKQ